MLHTGILTDGV